MTARRYLLWTRFGLSLAQCGLGVVFLMGGFFHRNLESFSLLRVLSRVGQDPGSGFPVSSLWIAGRLHPGISDGMQQLFRANLIAYGAVTAILLLAALRRRRWAAITGALAFSLFGAFSVFVLLMKALSLDFLPYHLFGVLDIASAVVLWSEVRAQSASKMPTTFPA